VAQKDALSDVVAPFYAHAELKGVSYAARLHSVYGSDLASQFKAVPQVTDAIKQRDSLQKRRASTVALPISQTERMGIEYF